MWMMLERGSVGWLSFDSSNVFDLTTVDQTTVLIGEGGGRDSDLRNKTSKAHTSLGDYFII